MTVSTPPQEEPPRQPWWNFTTQSRKAIAEHGGTVALLLPVLAVALFVVRCFVVSGFNQTVTRDLIGLSDPIELIRNTAVGLIDLLLWVVTWVATGVFGEALKLRRTWRGLLAATISVLGTVYIVVESVAQLGFVLLFPAVGVWIIVFGVGYEAADARNFWPFPLNPKRPSHVILASVIALFVGFALLGSGLNITSMWLPPERIVVRGHSPATLYVLSDTDDSLVVFDQNAHSVRRISAKTVVSRQFCSDNAIHRNGMPACP